MRATSSCTTKLTTMRHRLALASAPVLTRRGPPGEVGARDTRPVRCVNVERRERELNPPYLQYLYARTPSEAVAHSAQRPISGVGDRGDGARQTTPTPA